MTLARAVLALGALLCVAASKGRAQVADGAGSDSVQALFKARAAVRSFEQRWRTEIASQIPVPTIAPFASCEMRIGSGFCYGPSNGRISYTQFGTTPNANRFAPDLIPRVARRRANTLLDQVVLALREARQTIPGDQWIAGQLVQLHLERGEQGAAMEEAIECGAVQWWCNALRGHVLHMLGLEQLADSVWTNALYSIPLEERCLWLDPTDVIRSDSLRRVVAEMNCSAKVEFAERLWWLSDPLYLTAGNERRSEHLSRQVALLLDAYSDQRLDSSYVDMIMRGVRQTHAEEQLLGGNDLASLFRHSPTDITVSRVFAPAPLGYQELVRRLGVPGYFHITRPEPGVPPHLVALLPSPRFSFVPSASAILDQTHSQPSDWRVLDDNHHEFVALRDREFVELDYQLAMFRRGDSARIVAASDLASQPRLWKGGSTAALVLRRDYSEPGAIIQRRLRGDMYVEFANIPSGRTYVSMEVLSRDSTLAGRVRFGAGPPVMPAQRVTLSDVLLFAPRARLPTDLEEAGVLALGGASLEKGAQIGIFWEVYGLNAGEKPSVVISLTRESTGVVQTISRAIRGRPLVDRMSVEWDEDPAAGSAVEVRATDLDLATLAAGRYTLSLEVRVEGQQVLQAIRRIEIRN